MDRLYVVTFAVVGLAACLVACEKGSSSNGADNSESRGRVNAVQAKPKPEAPPPEAFCDVYNRASEAPDFEFPVLDKEAPAGPETGWHWVNVWATWCKPCIEEMPRLVEWERQIAGVGALTLLSVDKSRDLVTSFRKKHPETPESLLIADTDALQPWLKKFGVFKGASLPIHLFVDPGGKLRCVRAGGISENDRGSVEKLVQK